MNSKPVSVFAVTLNEEQYLARMLASVQEFAEIIVVDSGSTDRTVEIAKQFGAKVYHKEWMGFARQKAYALSLCQNEWALNLDGDEVLPPEMPKHIQKLVDEERADAYRLYFEDIFWGEPMASGSAKRSIVRLYRKSDVSFPLNRLVHENVKLSADCKQGRVPGSVIHFGYPSVDVLMAKQNKYSSLKALEKFQAGKKPSLLKLVAVFPLMFIKAYFIKQMFLSGRRGLVKAVIEAMYGFLKEAKLHEHYFTDRLK
ncbi:glycosyltransferase family 2 protein [Alteromonas pelagimontana]|uniref:Glycosyltransferase family 2 protein n=1 Tax=Alteromonas pelagimontana TaxID=1858656 RepID=A0A6M4MDB3_9ALTE|nr:glycosyltransferase family 2 protein [Alteromonas pelagimontana]QJR81007.1 glycosyltransferase family 2 protein [Alteromonas pelagimontana]